MPRALYDVNPVAWFAACDLVRDRARGMCEWCGLRRMAQTHHRWGYGAETLDCLMGVCRPCHLAVHGLRSAWDLKVAPDSLASRGDAGFGRGRHWLSYLDSQAKAERSFLKANE